MTRSVPPPRSGRAPKTHDLAPPGRGALLERHTLDIPKSEAEIVPILHPRSGGVHGELFADMQGAQRDEER